MKRPAFKLSAISALVMVLCAACGSGDDDGLDLTTNWLGPIRHYERLSGEALFGVYLHKNGTRPARVLRIDVAPAEITVSTRSDLNALSPAAYEQLRAAFEKALTRQIANRLPATTGTEQKGADAYILRAALTNLTIKRVSKKFGPAGLRDLEFSFDNSAIEISLHEYRSNARRAVIVQKAEGPKLRWSALADRFDAIALQAAQKTAEAREGIDKKANQPEKPPEKPAKPKT
jgi:hypothetical protein